MPSFVLVKRAHPVLRLAVELGKIGKCLFSFADDRLTDAIASWLDADFEDIGTHIEAISD